MRVVCYARWNWSERLKYMLCCALVCYDIWTNTPLYTGEFQTFRNKMIRSQSLPVVCNVNIYSLKKSIQNGVKIRLNAMLLYICFGTIGQMRIHDILYYSMIFRCFGMIFQCSGMIFQGYARYLNVCHAMVCFVKDTRDVTVKTHNYYNIFILYKTLGC